MLTDNERAAIERQLFEAMLKRREENGRRYYPGRDDDSETLASLYFDVAAELREARRLLAKTRHIHLDACWCDASGRSGQSKTCLLCQIDAFLSRTSENRTRPEGDSHGPG